MTGLVASRRRALVGALGLGISLFAAKSTASPRDKPALPMTNDWRWGVTYGGSPEPGDAAGLRLLVLEPDHIQSVSRFAGGPLLIGYVSLGEIEKSRPYADEAREAGLLSQHNPNWPNANYVDLRDEHWHRLVIDRIIPPLLERGFDGIFFDTLDNAETMEAADPVAGAGMVAGATRLVRAIRAAFPQALLVMNRGYALLPNVADAIDVLLGEAMASHWNFAAKRYELRSDADWQWQAERLRGARAVNPQLRLLTLDYWDPEDRATVSALYARERAAGFLPYVSILALDRLIPEAVA